LVVEAREDGIEALEEGAILEDTGHVAEHEEETLREEGGEKSIICNGCIEANELLNGFNRTNGELVEACGWEAVLVKEARAEFNTDQVGKCWNLRDKSEFKADVDDTGCFAVGQVETELDLLLDWDGEEGGKLLKKGVEERDGGIAEFLDLVLLFVQHG
jgi:hypothetical protein